MTASLFNASAREQILARLAALGVVLSLLEASFPMPLPGLKLGLGNMTTFFAWILLDFRAAIWVSLLRIFASALFLGHILTIGFVLSLAGGIASLALLSLAHVLPRAYFSLYSFSILSALAHILGQAFCLWLWQFPLSVLLWLLPILCAFALITGTLNAYFILRILGNNR